MIMICFKRIYFPFVEYKNKREVNNMETISEIDKKKLIEMAYNELIEETEQEIKRLKKEYELHEKIFSK